MRHPLMQGSGVTYNRIAGPTPFGTNPIGQYNGVLIARIIWTFPWSTLNAESSLSSMTLRPLLGTILRVSCSRCTDHRTRECIDDWQRIYELRKVSARGGEADAEAQARSQYYLFDRK